MPEFASSDNYIFFWTIASLAAFFVGFSKNGISGAGILAIPAMALVFTPKESTGVILPMLIAGDIIAVYCFRRHGEWKYILKSLPWAFPGIIAGWAMMNFSGISQRQFSFMIGLIVMAVLFLGEWLAYKKSDSELHIPHKWWFAAVFGVLGGFTTMTANAAGPIFAIYLIVLNLPKDSFIGTTAWIFFLLNTSKLPLSCHLGFITVDTLIFNIKMLPFIAVGAFVGYRTQKIIPQKSFTLIVKLLAAAAALKLIFT